jgi:septal ring factor EnvC (AmiA/AmiB activator)
MPKPALSAETPSRRPPGRSWRTLVAGIGLGLCLGLALPAAQADRKPTPAQKEAELKRVNARIEKVRKAVNEDVEKRDKLSTQLRDAELSVQAAKRRLDDLRAQRIDAEARLRDLEAEKAQREAELDGERSALAGELRAAYFNGREEELKLLLNQEDPAAFGRTLAYYGYFGRARAARIQGIKDKLEHLALLREKIAAETARLQQLESQQETEVAALKTAQDNRAGAVSAIDQQLKTRGGELQRLQ